MIGGPRRRRRLPLAAIPARSISTCAAAEIR